MIDMYYSLALSYNWRCVVVSQSYAVGFFLIRRYYSININKRFGRSRAVAFCEKINGQWRAISFYY